MTDPEGITHLGEDPEIRPVTITLPVPEITIEIAEPEITIE